MAAAALSSLSFTGSFVTNWNAVVNASSLSSGITNINNISNTFPFTSKNANTAVDGCDLMAVVAFNIAGSGNTVINLQNITDICGRTANSFARIKLFQFTLYGVGETTPDGNTAGTACSAITIGNASNPFPLNFSSGSSTATVNNSSVWEYADGSTTGLVVTATTNINVKILNADSVNAAVGLAIFVGGST